MSRIAQARRNGFLDMLAAERGAARNTLDAYQRDIDDYLEFLGGGRWRPRRPTTSAAGWRICPRGG